MPPRVVCGLRPVGSASTCVARTAETIVDVCRDHRGLSEWVLVEVNERVAKWINSDHVSFTASLVRLSGVLDCVT